MASIVTSEPTAADGPVAEASACEGSAALESFITDVFARGCPSRSVVETITGKWGVLVLLALAQEPRRFNALRRKIDGVSEKMLSQTLHTLERDGMVLRDVQKSIPPQVEYSLTALGERIAAPLRALIDLVTTELPEVLRSRDEYRERPR